MLTPDMATNLPEAPLVIEMLPTRLLAYLRRHVLDNSPADRRLGKLLPRYIRSGCVQPQIVQDHQLAYFRVS